MSARGLLGRLVVALVATELTLRAVLLVEAVELKVVSASPWDHAARMLWTDRRLKAAITGSPPLTWEEAGGEEAWDPELGWTRRPGRPESDEHGCRDGGLPRAPGAHRVVLVGDSFTFGTDVGVVDTFGHQLEQRRPDVDVHNLGMPAYDHLQAALRWERDGAPIRPEAVVLVGIDADLPRSTFWFYAYAKPWPELGPAGDLVVRGTPVDAPAVVLAKGLARPRLVDLFQIVADRRGAAADATTRSAEAERRVVAVLDRWAASVQATGALPVFFAIPIPNQIDAHGHALGNPRDRAVYARWCEGRTFPCEVAWDEFLDGVTDPVPLTANAHYARAGHARIADMVERRLVAAGVLPPTADVTAVAP